LCLGPKGPCRGIAAVTSTAFRMTRRRKPASPALQAARPQSHPGLAILAFTAPLFLWAEVAIIGRLFVTEIILTGALPFLLLTRGRMLAAPLPRMFMLLALFWLISLVVTDLYRGTPFVDYSRGWSKVTFLTTDFMAIYLLTYGSRQRLILFAVGLAFGSYLTYLLNPSEFALAQPWKFGIGSATIMLASAAVIWPPIARSPLLPAAIIGALVAVSLFVGSRSLAGIATVTALYILAQQILARRARGPSGFSAWRSLTFLVVALGISLAFLNIYGVLASEGVLGEDAREKYERQSTGAFGVILGGRTEIFISVQAIMDSPLLGHGSWAKDPRYSELLLELEDLGYEVDYNAAEQELIPTHSHLFGAYVEAGLLGAVFWVWVMFLALRVMSNLFLVREPLSPLIAFLGFSLIWDVLFSPFGAERRVIMPYYIILLMFAWETLRASVPEEALMRFRKLVPRRRRPNRAPLPTRPQHGRRRL
jgi:hypothetical protein